MHIRNLLVKSVSPVLKCMREPPDSLEAYKQEFGSLGQPLFTGVERARRQSGNKPSGGSSGSGASRWWLKPFFSAHTGFGTRIPDLCSQKRLGSRIFKKTLKCFKYLFFIFLTEFRIPAFIPHKFLDSSPLPRISDLKPWFIPTYHCFSFNQDLKDYYQITSANLNL